MKCCFAFSRWVLSVLRQLGDGTELRAEIICLIIDNRVFVDYDSYGGGVR